MVVNRSGVVENCLTVFCEIVFQPDSRWSVEPSARLCLVKQIIEQR